MITQQNGRWDKCLTVGDLHIHYDSNMLPNAINIKPTYRSEYEFNFLHAIGRVKLNNDVLEVTYCDDCKPSLYNIITPETLRLAKRMAKAMVNALQCTDSREEMDILVYVLQMFNLKISEAKVCGSESYEGNIIIVNVPANANVTINYI